MSDAVESRLARLEDRIHSMREDLGEHQQRTERLEVTLEYISKNIEGVLASSKRVETQVMAVDARVRDIESTVTKAKSLSMAVMKRTWPGVLAILGGVFGADAINRIQAWLKG